MILPPSETKTDGGTGEPLDFRSLSFAELTGRRKTLVSAVRRLAKDADATMAALKIGPKLRGEVDRNRTLVASATIPAIERYTGVLYDGLGAADLNLTEREFAAEHVVIHSALFGLIGAQDPIPAYRLSHDARIPQHPLKKHWRDAVARVLSEQKGLILDLRSEGYVGLGPAPVRANSFFLRVLARGANGQKRALNHFNKKGKGAFVRALLERGCSFDNVDELLEWASGSGLDLQAGAPGELELLTDETVKAR